MLSEAFVGNCLPILCNQENFVLKGNIYKILQSFPKYHPIIKPAFKETDTGRARNGMWTIVPEFMKNMVSDVSPSNWRVQAVLISFNNSNILLVNSYFPVDDRNNEAELFDALEAINSTIEAYKGAEVFLIGDLNADFGRNSAHCQKIRNFLQDCDLSTAWSSFPVDFTHSQKINGTPHFAILDHLL